MSNVSQQKLSSFKELTKLDGGNSETRVVSKTKFEVSLGSSECYVFLLRKLTSPSCVCLQLQIKCQLFHRVKAETWVGGWSR